MISRAYFYYSYYYLGTVYVPANYTTEYDSTSNFDYGSLIMEIAIPIGVFLIISIVYVRAVSTKWKVSFGRAFCWVCCCRCKDF
jgi:hypothetical protein